MMELIIRSYRSFVYFCNFTDEANSHTFEVEIHTRQTLCYIAKVMLFCQKSYHLGYRDPGNRGRGLFLEMTRKLFGPVKPFLVHLYLKTNKCIRLKLLV